MNVGPDRCAHSVLASSIVRPPCSGSDKTPVSNVVHVRPPSWHSHGQALLLVLLALVVFPSSASAAPPMPRPGAVQPRQGPPQSSGNGPQSNGSISINVWLPILLVIIMFILFSFITCIRRCAAADATTTTVAASRTANVSTHASANTTRPRRRPRRTPSQISTKSLPPYMKEPGDQELVLFRGPSETEDDTAPPQAMPTLAEDDEEHPGMHGATFDILLDRVETMDTMADASTTQLVRRPSTSVPRPPELHHPPIPRDHRRSGDARSLDSVGSDAELLATHQRGVSVDHGADPRGEAPPYEDAVFTEGRMSIISLNDPDLSHVSANVAVPPSLVPRRGRSRFSFLMQNPFSSHNPANGAPSNVNESPSRRSESPALHVRSGSVLSRFSTRESHESRHSRTLSRNNNLSHSPSRSNSNLLRVLRSHSPGLHAGSSTISLDSISAPLTHTVTRAEFYAPKGGLLTPEQIRLITSREALERFGVPYGPDAVAAFSLSRERLAEIGPPPDFESVAGTGASGGGSSATEAIASRSEALEADAVLARSTSHRTVERAGSRANTVVSYATVPESSGDASRVQTVQTHASGEEGEMDEDEPRTARPMTPRTARPWSLSGDH